MYWTDRTETEPKVTWTETELNWTELQWTEFKQLHVLNSYWSETVTTTDYVLNQTVRDRTAHELNYSE